jgi:hypothetical protein
MSVHPIAFETLVALWAGELAGAELDTVEEHLFACDSCAAASDQIARLVGGMREMISPVLTRAQVDVLVAGGVRVCEMPIDQPAGHVARFTPDIDLFVFAMRADLTGAERVDIELLDPHGTVHVQLLNVPFDASRGEVLVACKRHYASYESRVSDTPSFRIVATAAGIPRNVAQYAIKHIFS